jgi:hypothetical protein
MAGEAVPSRPVWRPRGQPSDGGGLRGPDRGWRSSMPQRVHPGRLVGHSSRHPHPGGDGAGSCAPMSPTPARPACGAPRRCARTPTADCPGLGERRGQQRLGPTRDGIGGWPGRSTVDGSARGASETESTVCPGSLASGRGAAASPGSRGSSGRPACSEVGPPAGAGPAADGAARQCRRPWRPARAQPNQTEGLRTIMKAKVRTTMTSSCRAHIVPGHNRDAEVAPHTLLSHASPRCPASRTP